MTIIGKKCELRGTELTAIQGPIDLIQEEDGLKWYSMDGCYLATPRPGSDMIVTKADVLTGMITLQR